jgi:hypothetical protein|tara:strand:+ start:287 stop:559 length:273 start_codon:yes stop_codon:yes gene_type:complete
LNFFITWFNYFFIYLPGKNNVVFNSFSTAFQKFHTAKGVKDLFFLKKICGLPLAAAKLLAGGNLAYGGADGPGEQSLDKGEGGFFTSKTK